MKICLYKFCLVPSSCFYYSTCCIKPLINALIFVACYVPRPNQNYVKVNFRLPCYHQTCLYVFYSQITHTSSFTQADTCISTILEKDVLNQIFRRITPTGADIYSVMDEKSISHVRKNESMPLLRSSGRNP